MEAHTAPLAARTIPLAACQIIHGLVRLRVLTPVCRTIVHLHDVVMTQPFWLSTAHTLRIAYESSRSES